MSLTLYNHKGFDLSLSSSQTYSSIPKVWFAGREILGTIHDKQLGGNFRSCSSKGKLRKPQAAGQARVCHTAVTGAFLCLVSEGCACVLSCDNSLVPHGKRSGILQAVMLEWVAISSSRGAFRSRDRTCISCFSCIGRQIFFFF